MVTQKIMTESASYYFLSHCIAFTLGHGSRNFFIHTNIYTFIYTLLYFLYTVLLITSYLHILRNKLNEIYNVWDNILDSEIVHF